MDKLRFHDNDGQIIDELEQLISDIQEFYADEYNSVFIYGLTTIVYNDVNLHSIGSEIIGGDYTDDGAYVYTLPSKYLANRKVDYAELRFKWELNMQPNYQPTLEEDLAACYVTKLIHLLRYILKYSYRATSVKTVKAKSKRINYKHVKSRRPPRPVRTDEEYQKNKELLGSVYGTTATNSFDDYNSFLGSFAQPNPIPCDGEDQ